MRYRVNEPAVASQVSGGEAMLIHFDSGRYYSIEGSGAEVIGWLEEGRSIGEIVAAWGEAEAGHDAIENEVERFVRALVSRAKGGTGSRPRWRPRPR